MSVFTNECIKLKNNRFIYPPLCTNSSCADGHVKFPINKKFHQGRLYCLLDNKINSSPELRSSFCLLFKNPNSENENIEELGLSIYVKARNSLLTDIVKKIDYMFKSLVGEIIINTLFP